MGPEVVIAKACRVDHIDDPRRVLMTFRTIRHRLTLVAAIAALATSAAVQATPASAAPPDSGLGANGAGDGPVGPSGCRGDCGSGGGLDCSRGDLDPDVRAAYCDNVPIVEVSPEQAKLAQFMKERCPGLNQAECSKFMRSRDWMKYATPDSCAAGDITGCALQTLPDRAKDLEAAVKATAGTVPEVKLEACPPGQTAACLDAIKAKLETPPATEAPAAPATEA